MSLLLLFTGEGGEATPDLSAVIRYIREAQAAASMTAERLGQAAGALESAASSGTSGESIT